MGMAYFMIHRPDFAPSGLDQSVQLVLGALAVINILSASAISRAICKTQNSIEHSSIIVEYAIRESGAVLGFVLSLLSGDLNWVLGLGGLALAIGILKFPKN